MSSGFDSLRDLEQALKPTEPTFIPRPKVKVLSRGTEIDRMQVIEEAGGIYDAIHLAARATRRILMERRKTEMDPYVTNVDGLKTIEAGEIDPRDRLLKPTTEWLQDYYAKKANEGWFWFR